MKKTDHGSMRFGHIRDNVQAVRPNRLKSIRRQVSRRCCGLFTNVIESKWPPISPYMFGLVASVGK